METVTIYLRKPVVSDIESCSFLFNTVSRYSPSNNFKDNLLYKRWLRAEKGGRDLIDFVIDRWLSAALSAIVSDRRILISDCHYRITPVITR